MNFNQFRRSQFDNYLMPLEYTLGNEKTQSEISTSITFVDKAISLEGNNILLPTELDGIRSKSYFIRFKIYKQSTKQQYLVKLINTNKTKDSEQTIKKLEIDSGNTKSYSTFEIVISPNNTYNQIKFELQREADDYKTVNKDGTYGRVAKIEISRLDEVYNIVNYLNDSIDGKQRLLQIGVQSAPGLMMCINGEEIKVGRSGIYEINNGYKITFIGFIVEPNDKKYFMLDYRY